MIKHLYLEDLEGHTEEEVKNHIANYYAYVDTKTSSSPSTSPTPTPTVIELQALANVLEDYNVVIAYENVGNYGWDSS